MAEGWIFDSIVGYMVSPLWTVPLATFIENNCLVFDNEEENKLEYTVVHKHYKELVEGLLENFLADIGISPTAFVDVLEAAGEHEASPDLEAALTSVAASEDFLVFKAMMVEKNLELEMQVRALYEAQVTKSAEVAAPAPAEAGQIGDEDEILQQALRLSLQEFQAEEGSGWDDSELAAALEASRLEQDALMAKAKAQASKRAAASLADLPALPGAGGSKAKAASSKPPPPPKAMSKVSWTPGLSATQSATSASAAAAAWITDAAKESDRKISARPKSAIGRSRESAGRMEYLQEQRAKLLTKRAAERDAKLQAYKEGATAAPTPPPPPAGGAVGQGDAGESARRALAARLKREVVDRRKP